MTDGARIHLPDLPPDLRFVALPHDERSFVHSFDVKRAALQPFLEARGGWDDALQKRLHRERFAEKPFTRILWRDRAVGTVSVMRLAGHVRFGEFYLLSDDQRLGLGSRVLRHCLMLADATSLPVTADYLKGSPVASLYRRHGFTVVGETEACLLIERPLVDSSRFAFDHHT